MEKTARGKQLDSVPSTEERWAEQAQPMFFGRADPAPAVLIKELPKHERVESFDFIPL